MTTCTPLPSSALRYAGSVATSVLPSPVTISAMLPLVQDHAADHLHVVMPHAEEPPAAFAADGERLDQDVVERFAGLQALAELDGLLAQLLIGHRLVLRLQRVDRLDLRLQAAEEAGVGRAEHGRHAPLEPVHQAAEEVADAIPGSFK